MNHLVQTSFHVVHVLVIVLHPLLSPLHDLLKVTFQVLRRVTGQLVDDLLFVGLHGLLVNGLEDLTLHVVLQLFPCVAPVSDTTRREAVSNRRRCNFAGGHHANLVNPGDGFNRG